MNVSPARTNWRPVGAGTGSAKVPRRGAVESIVRLPDRAYQRRRNMRRSGIVPGPLTVEGRRHSGLIFTSDVSMPRGRQTMGRSVNVLEVLLQANPREDAFTDRVQWL